MNFRYEEKLKLNNKKVFYFYDWLNNKKAKNIYPDREVYSIYFDNSDFQTYFESIEGVVPRKKLRLRTYNFENYKINNFNLETKKTISVGRLKSSKNTYKTNQFLKSGIYMNEYGICYPKIIVKYTRSYYKLNNIRITFDKNIEYKIFNLINNHEVFYNKSNLVVVELKFSSIDYMKNIKLDLPFEKTRFSKYCYGIESLYNI